MGMSSFRDAGSCCFSRGPVPADKFLRVKKQSSEETTLEVESGSEFRGCSIAFPVVSTRPVRSLHQAITLICPIHLRGWQKAGGSAPQRLTVMQFFQQHLIRFSSRDCHGTWHRPMPTESRCRAVRSLPSVGMDDDVHRKLLFGGFVSGILALGKSDVLWRC